SSSSGPTIDTVETDQSGTDWLLIRTRTVGGPTPISGPGSRCTIPAHREPSPVPDSSLTTKTSTGPSSALVPELHVSLAFASRPSLGSPPTARSLSAHPGLTGHGRYVGTSPAVANASATPSYDASSGRRRAAVGPWSGHDQPLPFPWGAVFSSGIGQRGHSVR